MDPTNPLDLQLQIEAQVRLDEITQGYQQIQNPSTGGTGSGGGSVPVTGFSSLDGFLAITTPSPTTRDFGKGPDVGDLWDKDPAAAITDPPTLTSGGLPIGAAYTQSEVIALRDAVIVLNDKVIELLDKLQAAGIVTP